MMNSPEQPSDHLPPGMEELYFLMNQAFNSQLDKEHYAAEFHLPVSDSSPAYNVSEKIFGKKPEKGQPWIAAVGFIPKVNELGFTSLEMPLKVPNSDESIVLRRITTGGLAGDFIVLHKKGEDEKPLVDHQEGSEDTLSMNAYNLERLIALAGYGLPHLFTSPEDIRIALAELSDTSTRWQTTKQFCIPQDAMSETTFKQIISCRVDEGVRKHNTKLTAISETFTDDRTKRKQAGFSFSGDGYFVESLEIARLELNQIDVEFLGQTGTEIYETTSTNVISPTKGPLDLLCEGMINTLVNTAILRRL